jgi:ATP-dependent Clp protease ATP-binding subunit ClpC
MLFDKPEAIKLMICRMKRTGGLVIGGEQKTHLEQLSSGYVSGSKFLYWGRRMTRYHLKYRRARQLLNKFHIIGGALFTLGFFGIFFTLVYSRGLDVAMYSGTFWTGRQPLTILFWLGVTSACYTLYRVLVLQKPPTLVELPTDKKKDTLQLSAGHRQTLSSRQTIDISKTFTPQGLRALESSYSIADQHGDKTVTPIHIFLGLLADTQVMSLFVRLGIGPKRIRAELMKQFSPTNNNVMPLFSAEAQQIVFQSYAMAKDVKQEYVNVTEILYATILQSEQLQESLYDLKIDKKKLTNVIEWMRIQERMRRQYKKYRRAASRRSKHGMDRAMTAVATPFLNNYSQDVTMAAKFNQLEPCVARDKEIEEIFRVIEGGQQSVLLVGDRGVGKMSIIEGIAQRMIEDDVPKRLQDRRLVQLSTSALMAGTTTSGAQQRIIQIMNEIAKAKNIILFIDGIQDLVSGGEGGEGLDVSETLSEYIGGSQFLTLATATNAGYNQHILNSALGSAVTKVDVNEMEEDQAIQVLESKVGRTEYKHKVFFSYAAVEQAVQLAMKFLHDQHVPENALALMSEAASFTKSKKGENSMVQAEDVAAVVAQKTGIPTTSISEDESSKLMRLEEEMHNRVIGQHDAVSLVASALRRARAEIRSQKRPIANFLFLGPTGVGKTELAKTISSVYFGGEERMVRIDMSEFQDKAGVYRLIGQPGQQGSGLLAEAVRQQPFSLVLLDELEKADPDILNLFLQVFDDGRMTDSVGRVIDFTNTIIIATSNAGTSFVQEQIQKKVPLDDIRQSLIKGKLKEYYRPEFLNRFDGIVLFKALERPEIKQIAGLMLKRVAKDLEKRGVFFRAEEAGLEALAQVGFDPEFGARPMRRAIQDKVENALAELVLQKKLNRRDTVVLGANAEIRVESAN